MSDKVFNFMRFCAEILIGAIGAFYYAVAEAVGLPYGKEVVAVCAALSTLVGVITEWQRYRYQKTKEENNNGTD